MFATVFVTFRKDCLGKQGYHGSSESWKVLKVHIQPTQILVHSITLRQWITLAFTERDFVVSFPRYRYSKLVNLTYFCQP